MGWSGEAANLREMGRLHDARVLIDAAMLRFPEDLIAVTEAIRIVDRLDDGEAGLSLRQRMIQLQPDEPRWWTGYLEMLLQLSRIDEAEAELPAALLQHPCDPRLGLMTTLFALRRHQWDRATSLLETHAFASDAPLVDAAKAAANERLVHCPEESRFLFSCLRRRQPADASVAHGLVDSLLRCGRYVEAGARLKEALISFPEDCHLKFAAALHALKVEKWDAAIDGFIDLIARRPDYPGASQHLGLARMEKAFRSNHDAASQADPQRQDVGLVEDDAMRRLLLGFESLGQDCELGLVQRRFGAEPLGLFRWNFVEPELLCEALASGFDGFGAEANTEMALWKDDEYYLRDRRWGFAFHTWVTRHEVDGDEHFSKMSRRLTYLKDKFLADLASAEKVFVLKTTTRAPMSCASFIRACAATAPCSSSGCEAWRSCRRRPMCDATSSRSKMGCSPATSAALATGPAPPGTSTSTIGHDCVEESGLRSTANALASALRPERCNPAPISPSSTPRARSTGAGFASACGRRVGAVAGPIDVGALIEDVGQPAVFALGAGTPWRLCWC